LGKGMMRMTFPNVEAQTTKYINENLAVAKTLNKPLVIEEFGLPRDDDSYDSASDTGFRDRFYRKVFSYIGNQPGGDPFVAGANFWAFGGYAKPIKGQTFWKEGDEYMGDPPMEEQGLNSVFATDHSTWRVIRSLRQ
jgi:mannan endo-1,4-beta-mannosidase